MNYNSFFHGSVKDSPPVPTRCRIQVDQLILLLQGCLASKPEVLCNLHKALISTHSPTARSPHNRVPHTVASVLCRYTNLRFPYGPAIQQDMLNSTG